MRVLVIGATGHIGSYLVPRLAARGFEVVALSRGERRPYCPWADWKNLETVRVDRGAEEERGSFGRRLRELGPDVVVDLTLFRAEQLPPLLEALAGRIRQYLYCGSMWVYGPSERLPTTEEDPRLADEDYGRQKAELERLLLAATHDGRFPASVLHPGHISGPGWPIIGPTGNLNPEVFGKLARGERVLLPDLGLGSLHHVHADDVAQAFELALLHPRAALGESFNVVSPRALTLRGFCRAVAGWFGREPELGFLPWEQWKETVSGQDAEDTWEHIRHSPCGSSAKARRLLGFEPRFDSLQTMRQALDWLIREGRVEAPPLS